MNAQTEHEKTAVVIGSGFAGSVTALRLAEAGVKVVIIERGRKFEDNDYPLYPTRNTKKRTKQDNDNIADTLPVDFSRWFWRLDNGLVDYRDLKDVSLVQGAAWGGGSQVYANVHLRPPEFVFTTQTAIGEAVSKQHNGTKVWPKEYQELEGYYNLAAYKMDVQVLPEKYQNDVLRAKGFKNAYHASLDGKKHNVASKHFYPPLTINFPDDVNNIKDHECDLRGYCMLTCKRQAKNVLSEPNAQHKSGQQKRYLNQLDNYIKSGQVSVKTLCEVTHIKRDHENSSYKIIYDDLLTKGQRTSRGGISQRSYQARQQKDNENTLIANYVFLCAGTVNTIELLFRNTAKNDNDEYPNLRLSKSAEKALGKNFYTNADEYSMIFDCKEIQESSRGPTITSGIVVDTSTTKHKNFILIEDGGASHELEPYLGMFRSPLWGRRNKVSRKLASDDLYHQKTPYWRLPFDNLREVFMSIPGQKVDLSRAVAQSVELDTDNEKNKTESDPSPWQFLPRTIRDAISRNGMRLRLQMQDQLSPLVDGILTKVATEMRDGEFGIEKLRKRFVKDANSNDVADQFLERRLLTFVIQMFQGSESEMSRYMIKQLYEKYIPQTINNLAGSFFSMLTWAMDFRVPNNRTTVLLAMGLDTKAATIRYDKNIQSLTVDMPKYSQLPERRQIENLYKQLAINGYEGELRLNPMSKIMNKFVTVHPQGGAIMGDADFGVTDFKGCLRECNSDGNQIDSNIFIMDGSNFPTPVGVNPTATILAMAEYKIERILNVVILSSDKPRYKAEEFNSNLFNQWVIKNQSLLDPLGNFSFNRKTKDSLKDDQDFLNSGLKLSFKERMDGVVESFSNPTWSHRRDLSEVLATERHRLNDNRTISATLTISTLDIRRFLDQYDEANIVPSLDVSGYIQESSILDKNDGIERVINCGSVQLFLKSSSNLIGCNPPILEDPVDAMFVYYIFYNDYNNVLYGEKHLQNNGGLDYWIDTTTLFLRLGSLRDEYSNQKSQLKQQWQDLLTDEKDGIDHTDTKFSLLKQYYQNDQCGIIRLSADEFFSRQVTSIDVQAAYPGVDADEDERAIAVAAFLKFFTVNSMDIYRAGTMDINAMVKKVFSNVNVQL